MSRILKAAVVQLRSSADPEDNFGRILEFLKKTSKAGARLVVLPENCLCHGPLEKIRRQARTLKRWHSEFISRLEPYKFANCAIVWGGLPERAGSRIYDTAVVSDENGEILGFYRKKHLFSYFNGCDNMSLCESDVYSPGSKGLCLKYSGWRIGISICFDLRFPSLYLNYGRPEIAVCCAAFTEKTGKAHWETLIRARAIENQCYFLAANQHVPAMLDCPPTYGHSIVVDPWGAVLECKEAGEGILIHALGMDQLENVRNTVRMV